MITTNWNAPNFRLMTASEDALVSREGWKELVPHASDVFIEGVELFDGYMAIGERSDGLRRIRILKDDGDSQFVKSDEPAYTMGLAFNAEPDTTKLRYNYTSLTTPNTVYEVDTRGGERVMLKVKHQRTADCAVAGYRLHKDGNGVGSLLLGLFDAAGAMHNALRHAGRA